MKRSYSWLLVCLCIVLGAGAVGAGAGFALRFFSDAARSQFEHEFASQLDPSHPRYREVMCGPMSLSIALGRMGVNLSSAEIASQCKVTSQGVALTDLERVANSIRLVSGRIRRINWDELSHLDGVAILFVKGDHYLAVDPRESLQLAAQSSTMRIYQPERPAEWWSRDKLEKVWRGETLAISRQPAHVDEAQSAACIDWKESFLDQGVFSKGARLARYQFAFRNVGNKDLEIGDIQKSCGCIDYKLSKKQFAPGESGTIEVNVNLARLEGYFQQHVIVKTNDETTPKSMLRMAGGAPRSRVISCDLIRLEDLPQGGKVSQKFYIADPKFGGVKIHEFRFVPLNRALSNDHLTCSFSYSLIGKELHRSPTVFRAKPTDYEVQLTFEASKGCPVGPFQGEVSIVLDAEGTLSSHKVVIEGAIVQDVNPFPRVVLLTVDAEGAGVGSVQLQSHSERAIEVVRTWSDDPKSLKISHEDEAQGANGKFTISARVSGMKGREAPLQRSASFELSDGAVVSVPVVIYKPSQE